MSCTRTLSTPFHANLALAALLLLVVFVRTAGAVWPFDCECTCQSSSSLSPEDMEILKQLNARSLAELKEEIKKHGIDQKWKTDMEAELTAIKAVTTNIRDDTSYLRNRTDAVWNAVSDAGVFSVAKASVYFTPLFNVGMTAYQESQRWTTTTYLWPNIVTLLAIIAHFAFSISKPAWKSDALSGAVFDQWCDEVIFLYIKSHGAYWAVGIYLYFFGTLDAGLSYAERYNSSPAHQLGAAAVMALVHLIRCAGRDFATFISKPVEHSGKVAEFFRLSWLLSPFKALLWGITKVKTRFFQQVAVPTSSAVSPTVATLPVTGGALVAATPNPASAPTVMLNGVPIQSTQLKAETGDADQQAVLDAFRAKIQRRKELRNAQAQA
jgi:hypothetical protein